jgi:hypothetical protein
MKKTLLIVALFATVVVAGCVKKPVIDTNTMTGDLNSGTVATGVVVTGTVTMTGTVATGSTTGTVATAGTDVKIAADQKATWDGKKIGGAHSGTVNLLPESMLQVAADGTLLGGVVIAALSQITTSDLSGDMATKLVAHLTGSDFFDTANHPTAVFKATKVEASNVTADVTIRGITKSMTFPVTLTKDGEGYLLSAIINISRSDFKVGDTLAGKVALEDTFTLTLNKVAFMR